MRDRQWNAFGLINDAMQSKVRKYRVVVATVDGGVGAGAVIVSVVAVAVAVTVNLCTTQLLSLSSLNSLKCRLGCSSGSGGSSSSSSRSQTHGLATVGVLGPLLVVVDVADRVHCCNVERDSDVEFELIGRGRDGGKGIGACNYQVQGPNEEAASSDGEERA